MNPGKKKRNDLLLSGIFLAAALAVLFFQNFFMQEKGDFVTVTQDGEVIGQYSLWENRTIPLEKEHGYNLLVIENGSAKMAEADCPDKLCVKQRRISRSGESLICLPHKLIVTVDRKGQKETSGVDSVTY